MPTKNQAKTAIDNLMVLVKNDIDTTLPTGVNIIDGEMFANPNRWGLLCLASGLAQAETWTNSIIASLAVQGRPTPTIQYARRGDDSKIIEIRSSPAYYKITWS